MVPLLWGKLGQRDQNYTITHSSKNNLSKSARCHTTHNTKGWMSSCRPQVPVHCYTLSLCSVLLVHSWFGQSKCSSSHKLLVQGVALTRFSVRGRTRSTALTYVCTSAIARSHVNLPSYDNTGPPLHDLNSGGTYLTFALTNFDIITLKGCYFSRPLALDSRTCFGGCSGLSLWHVIFC